MNIRKIGVRHIEIVLNKLLDKSSKAIFTNPNPALIACTNCNSQINPFWSGRRLSISVLNKLSDPSLYNNPK